MTPTGGRERTANAHIVARTLPPVHSRAGGKRQQPTWESDKFGPGTGGNGSPTGRSSSRI